MAQERKMISARLSVALRDRIDFVARNTDHAKVKDRSSAITAAVEAWLPGQEDRLRELGILPKKAR